MASSMRSRAQSLGSGTTIQQSPAGDSQEFVTMPPAKDLRTFDPSAATAAMFLYAQGPSIVCCHHDTLTIERRFSRHSEEVQLLAVDNVSENGAGRLVVSYDAGQTAIVWDLMTGDEVARFASFDPLTTAAWMKTGNVAFGNSQGNIILFEPQTSEHLSVRTLDHIAVTALAPSSDCRTYAIGYQNGSLLIANLQPRFTILHNITTSRPAPVVTLSWHASSSRQKSDMLAAQNHEGDLRVWSVAKAYDAEDPAKVVRVLKKSDGLTSGSQWMAWSKNGRIIQYSDSQTLSWDVRTKHVTSDSIPTMEHVCGLAVYGPGATLFTIGPNNTVQQFDLNSPAIMVANVQHPANLLPPSPPNSIEEPGGEASARSATTINTSESDSSIPVDMGISESDSEHMSPFARLNRQHGPTDSGNEASNDSASPNSSRSGVSSRSKSSAGSRTPGRLANSLASRNKSDHTYISAGSSINTIPQAKRDVDSFSMGYSLPSTATSSMRSRQRPSRLRNEVPRSPDDSKVHDLFKYTRSRLSDIPYKHPVAPSMTRLTNDDLRRQMLRTIFGWHKEVEDLIKDEMNRHPMGSASRILLAKWLGDIDADIMAAGSQNMSSSDWMLLALSGIGGHASQHKLGRVYVQRLLESGDIHVAVTIMLGMGDDNDAIEVYISHKRYMEALLLTCLSFPGVWERQAQIIRKWGEWAVQHRQQQLAIRCFACTDTESTEPWSSPSAAQLNFQSGTPSIPEVLSPPLSPPTMQHGPQRSIAKSSALKLVTSFGDSKEKSKFYGQDDDAQTPLAAGVTPIAESAISPGASQDFLRPASRNKGLPGMQRGTQGSALKLITSFGDQKGKSKFYSHDNDGQTPIAAGVTPIAESAVSPGASFEAATAFLRPSNNSRFNTPTSAKAPSSTYSRGRLPSIGEVPSDLNRENLKMTADRGSSRGHARMSSQEQDNLAAGIALQRASTASPMMMRDKYQPLPSPDSTAAAKIKVSRHARNGSHERIPVGLNLQVKTQVDEEQQSAGSSTRYHWPTRRHGAGSVASSTTSNSSAGYGLRSRTKAQDDYIHSLDAAAQSQNQGRSKKHKDRSRESSRGRYGSHKQTKSREASEERGRAAARTWTKPKRSPTSPVPMSPQDLANLSTPRYSETGEPLTVRKAPRARTGSRASSNASRQRSPDTKNRPPALDIRGRGNAREGSLQRSPSSPLPLGVSSAHFTGPEDEDDLQKAMENQLDFRAKHSRSRSRGLNSPVVSKKERADSRRREAVDALDILPTVTIPSRGASTEHAGDLRKMKEERQRKKEQAARELEERRKSLAKRPQAPPIPQPPNQLHIGIETSEPKGPGDNIPLRCATEPPRTTYAHNGPQIGLPATPKAMRLIIEGDPNASFSDSTPPEVPPIPSTFSERHSPRALRESSPTSSKEKEPELLTLLPSTVYQPPRPLIARSMSAPIPDDIVPPPLGIRKASTGEIRGIDEIVGGSRGNSQRNSREDPSSGEPPIVTELQHLNQPPPVPPLAPVQAARPMLRELQHLATPPPPPPAPLPNAQRTPQTAYEGSAAIEVVTTDEETATADAVGVAAPNDGMVPIIPAPAPPSSKGHSRGRSIGDGSSLSSRLSRATERLRSASRGRNKVVPAGEAPYESIPTLHNHGMVASPPPVMFDQDVVRSPVDSKRSKHLSTGLHKSEMI